MYYLTVPIHRQIHYYTTTLVRSTTQTALSISFCTSHLDIIRPSIQQIQEQEILKNLQNQITALIPSDIPTNNSFQ